MKRIFVLFVALAIFAAVSCQGDYGEEGPQGPDAPPLGLEGLVLQRCEWYSATRTEPETIGFREVETGRWVMVFTCPKGETLVQLQNVRPAQDP